MTIHRPSSTITPSRPTDHQAIQSVRASQDVDNAYHSDEDDGTSQAREAPSSNPGSITSHRFVNGGDTVIDSPISPPFSVETSRVAVKGSEISPFPGSSAAGGVTHHREGSDYHFPEPRYRRDGERPAAHDDAQPTIAESDSVTDDGDVTQVSRKKRVIAIDFDDVILDAMAGALEWHNELYGTDLTLYVQDDYAVDIDGTQGGCRDVLCPSDPRLGRYCRCVVWTSIRG